MDKMYKKVGGVSKNPGSISPLPKQPKGKDSSNPDAN